MSQPFALAKQLQDEQAKEARLARIVEMEDRVYELASGVVEAALSFHEVDPQQPEPPEEWVKLYGQTAAEQRLRVAKSGWEPASVAPSGVKLAAQVAAGISRGRGYRTKLTQNNLNVKIELPAPTSSQHPIGDGYAVKDIE
jgi:hypothetical protein